MFNPYQVVPFRTISSGGGLLSKINWGNLLSNTQKTLNIVNQAIPIVYQVKPMINNAKTVFKVAKEFSNVNYNNTQNNNYNKNQNTNYNYYNSNDNQPTFFI